MNMLPTTPWGIAEYTKAFPVPGTDHIVIFVSTPSHGGFFVPDALLHRIPEKEQEFAKIWAGGKNWYEEDVCASSVVLAFPEVFNISTQDKMTYRKIVDDAMRRHDNRGV